MLRILLEAIIAFVLERSLSIYLPHLLPYAWLFILVVFTLEILNRKLVRDWFLGVYSRLGVRYRVLSYLAVSILGAGLLCFYWWGIGKTFALLEQQKPAPQGPKAEIPLGVPQQTDKGLQASPPQGVSPAKLKPEPQPPKAGPADKSITQEKPPTFKEKEEYYISIANNTMKIYPGKPAGLLGLDNDSVVVGHVEGGKILVDAKLHSGKGANPIEVKRNEFSMFNSAWDRNYNDTAFEVVNEDGIPVLQILYTTPHNVAVYGVFQSRGSILFVGPHGMWINPTKPPEPLKSIFKYPSRKYLGQEVDSR